MNENKEPIYQLPTTHQMDERVLIGYDKLLSMVEFSSNALFSSIRGTEGDGDHQRLVNFHVFSPDNQHGLNMTLFSIFSRGIQTGMANGLEFADRIEYQVRKKLGRVAVLVPGRKIKGNTEWVWYPDRNNERLHNVATILDNFVPNKTD